MRNRNRIDHANPFDRVDHANPLSNINQDNQQDKEPVVSPPFFAINPGTNRNQPDQDFLPNDKKDGKADLEPRRALK